MDNNINDNDIITLVEETEPKKVKKKRTYEQQKDRIIAYLKNRYANDTEYRNKINNERLIRSNLKYNTDEEYRKKTLDYMKAYRKAKIDETTKNKMEDEKQKLDDMLKNISSGKSSLSEIANAKRLYDRIVRKYPDYNIQNDIKI
jgi:hypothetical protein